MAVIDSSVEVSFQKMWNNLIGSGSSKDRPCYNLLTAPVKEHIMADGPTDEPSFSLAWLYFDWMCEIQ